MTEKEAWKAWRRQDRLEQLWRKDLRRIRLDIETVEIDMMLRRKAEREAAEARVLTALAENGRYRKVVDAFLDLRGYRKNMSGWQAACMAESALWKLTRKLEWRVLWNLLLRSRKERA